MVDPRRERNKNNNKKRRGVKPRSPEENEPVAVEEIEVVVDEVKPEDVEKTVEMLEKERDESIDRFQRLAAEFDNYRKRQARDFKRLIEQGRRKMIEELIPVLENFDRARQTCQGEHSDKEVVDGIMQTSDQLTNVLKKEGLSEVETKPGDSFDPNIHEAMAAENIEDGKVDIVLEVYQKGYFFGQDLIRPVRVKVGKVPSGNGG